MYVHPFTVPGIIPLTLIDANTVYTAIQWLSTIPALTTALRLRVEGMGTRASGPGQGPSVDQPPSSQVTAQVEEQSTSQSVDQSVPAEQQQVETEPFPGSSSLDWQSGLLGLRDRAQGRALDNIVAAVGKQFRPVSVSAFLSLNVFSYCEFSPVASLSVHPLAFYHISCWVIFSHRWRAMEAVSMPPSDD